MGGLQSRSLHVLVVGLDSCGKTTMLRQLAAAYGQNSRDKEFYECRLQPTIGHVAEIVQLPQGPRLTLSEIGGQRLLRDLWRYHVHLADGLVFVVDSNDPARFEEARAFLFEVVTCWELVGVPVLILANKQDLPFALPSWRIAAELETELLERLGHPVHVHSTVALTADGLLIAMHVLAKFIKQRRTS